MSTETTTAEPEAADKPDIAASPAPRILTWRLAGPTVGALLLILYVVLLARKDLDGFPGGWKAISAALLVALATVSGAALLRKGHASALSRWVVAHPAAITLGFITLGAFALRVFGISDNLPYINSPDEPAVADRALGILQTGDFNPHYFVYPNLYTYMQAAVYLVRFFELVSSGTLANIGSAVPVEFYLWGRLLTALLGTLTVLLVFWTGRRLHAEQATWRRSTLCGPYTMRAIRRAHRSACSVPTTLT